MTLLERLTSPGPKRILALDGGGIRGALTLGYLARLETLLRERHGRADLRLSDYFDLIGGTSTGAIIAAGLATGMTAEEITRRYMDLGGRVFGEKRLKTWEALLTLARRKGRSVFDGAALQEELTKVFGDATLGGELLKTGFCVIAKRADTRSTWPLINHPKARYYSRNKDIPLANAVRASTAAPLYFEPEVLDVGGGQRGAFVDGGVSMANNPALTLFLVATLKGFNFHWPLGEDRLLLVSIGTGTWRLTSTADRAAAAKVWDWAVDIPVMLMEDANWQNQLLLQYLSRSATPWTIDREIGDLGDDLLTPQPALTYLRYNVWLEPGALEKLGLKDLAPRAALLRKMELAENRYDLARVGSVAAQVDVHPEHLPSSFNLP